MTTSADNTTNPSLRTPSPTQNLESLVPDWARSGAFRYLRLDGGPDSAEKARLSGWPFDSEQRATLTGLYTTHRERVFQLLEEAHINWVWLTWSVGFSWETEAEQRRQCAEMAAECRRRGIHTTAYMTGNNMFWHDMFCQNPKAVNWLRRGENGEPVTYFGVAERFLAQMDHPEWLELQKRRLQSAMEAGFESFFYDNCDAWRSGEQAVVTMSQELRRFAREDLKSNALFYFNYMPHRFPPYIRHAGLLDWTFCEGHTPPAVADGQWIVVNPAHPAKYTAAIFGERPVIYETCTVHGFDRMETNQRTITPKQATRIIGEATAFASAQSFYVEGGFIHRLVHGTPADIETWKVIGAAYALLKKLAPTLVTLRQMSRLLVVGDAAPDSDPSKAIEAGHGLFEFVWHEKILAPLLRRSIPFDFCDVRSVDARRLENYDTVLLAGLQRAPQPTMLALRDFSDRGRLLFMDTHPDFQALASPFTADEEGFDRLRTQAPYQLSLANGPYVLGNLLGDLHTLALHVVNYSDEPVNDLVVDLRLADRQLPKTTSAQWLSPDAATVPPSDIAVSTTGIRCLVPKLDTWGLILLTTQPKN